MTKDFTDSCCRICDSLEVKQIYLNQFSKKSQKAIWVSSLNAIGMESASKSLAKFIIIIFDIIFHFTVAYETLNDTQIQNIRFDKL